MAEKGSKHVLIVDDDPFLTEMYTLSLTKEHVQIEVAHNGKDAIAKIEKRRPDVMLVDLLMPVMDGFTFLTHYNEKKWNFPVIVLSNITEKTDQDRCLDLGATDFFPKSETDLEKLRHKVKKYL